MLVASRVAQILALVNKMREFRLFSGRRDPEDGNTVLD